MFRIFAALILAAFSLSSAPTPKASSAIETQHATTHRIAVYDMLEGKGFNGEAGHCSGTAVGPHAILTAQHCLLDSNRIRLDDDSLPVHVLAALLDGNDHAIYLVDATFNTWSEIDERDLVPSEMVYMWGAPGDNTDVYRSGYFRKLDIAKEVDPSENFKFEWFILPIFPGDSGSGLFDVRGKIVSVVSMSDKSADCLNLPLNFTAAQLHVAASNVRM